MSGRTAATGGRTPAVVDAASLCMGGTHRLLTAATHAEQSGQTASPARDSLLSGTHSRNRNISRVPWWNHIFMGGSALLLPAGGHRSIALYCSGWG